MSNDTWDLAEFRKPHLPTVVAMANDLGDPDGLRVLDMPVSMDGLIRVPKFLGPNVAKMIGVALAYERLEHGWVPRYVYVTVDHKPMPPRGSQRRPGWHSDGWFTDHEGRQVDGTVENLAAIRSAAGHIDITYLISDVFPTLFAPGPWYLPAGCDDLTALESFDGQAAKQKLAWWTPAPNALVRLTPYCVHAAMTNPADFPYPRIFIKVSLSDHRYNMAGNTHNWLFDYDWPLAERATGARNHRHGVAA